MHERTGMKAAVGMAVLALGVAALDGYAALLWPATDMGGIVAKLMLLGLAVVELGPAIGFAALAGWAKARQKLGRRDTIVFAGVTALLLPISAIGMWIGVEVLAKWGA
jgi:hypothetical protein